MPLLRCLVFETDWKLWLNPQRTNPGFREIKRGIQDQEAGLEDLEVGHMAARFAIESERVKVVDWRRGQAV
jgi:hypothetical protein